MAHRTELSVPFLTIVWGRLLTHVARSKYYLTLENQCYAHVPVSWKYQTNPFVFFMIDFCTTK